MRRVKGSATIQYDNFKVLDMGMPKEIDGEWYSTAADTTITGGKLQFGTVDCERLAIRRGFRGSKYVLECDQPVGASNGNAAGVLLHYQDPENFMGVTFTKGVTNYTPKLVRRKDGDFSTIATGSAFSMTTGDRVRCAVHDRRKASLAFADELRREMGATENARHVIIAHSHGGNVALWALGELDEATRDRVAGLATMGTPFLHFAARSVTRLESFYLKLILRSRFMLGIAIIAIPILAFMLAFDKTMQTKDQLLGVIVGMCALIIYFTAWFRLRGRSSVLDELKPTCPARLNSFLSLRSRGDEASRAISIADNAVRSLVAGWSIVQLCAKCMPWDKREWRGRALVVGLITLTAATAAMLVYAAIDPTYAKSAFSEMPPGWNDWQYWLCLIALVPLCFALMITLMFLLAAFSPLGLAMVIIVYSQFMLALAFGPDTMSLAVATEIAAEPQPPRPATLLENVEPGEGESRHSVHAVSAARSRLAAWIRERQTAPSGAPHR